MALSEGLDGALYELWSALGGARGEVVRCRAAWLAAVEGGRGLVGEGWRGGAVVVVDRAALFSFLKSVSDRQGS